MVTNERRYSGLSGYDLGPIDLAHKEDAVQVALLDGESSELLEPRVVRRDERDFWKRRHDQPPFA